VQWVAQLEQAVLQTQAYLDAAREVMAINLELLAQTRQQLQTKRRTSKQKKRHATARRGQKTINKIRR
jgi:hypothetical protein